MDSPEQKIMNHITNSILDRTPTINMGNVMILLKDMMIAVDNFRGLTGEQKKRVVIECITRLIYKQGGEEKHRLALIAQFVIPDAIDIIIAGTRGLLNINKIVRKNNVCCI